MVFSGTKNVGATGIFQFLKQGLYRCCCRWRGREVTQSDDPVQKKMAVAAALAMRGKVESAECGLKPAQNAVDVGRVHMVVGASPIIYQGDYQKPEMREFLAASGDIAAYVAAKPETLHEEQQYVVSELELEAAFGNNFIYRTLFQKNFKAADKKPAELKQMQSLVNQLLAGSKAEDKLKKQYRAAIGAEFRENLGLTSNEFTKMVAGKAVHEFADVSVELIKIHLQEQAEWAVLFKKQEVLATALKASKAVQQGGSTESLVKPITKRIQTAVRASMTTIFEKFNEAAKTFVTSCKTNNKGQMKPEMQVRVVGALDTFENSFSTVMKKHKAFKHAKAPPTGMPVNFGPVFEARL